MVQGGRVFEGTVPLRQFERLQDLLASAEGDVAYRVEFGIDEFDVAFVDIHVDTGLSLDKIRFRYAVSGSNPPWKPLRAFDDGEKVYIQFPPGIAQGELPPLFVIGAQGDGQLVNYRFRSPYYVVDRLFGAAELRLGGDGGDVVRIERTDGVARRN